MADVTLPYGSLAVPSADKLHHLIAGHVPTIRELAAQHEDEPWCDVLMSHPILDSVKVHATGVYSFPYFTRWYCTELVAWLRTVDHTVNEAEPEAARIPEFVFQHHSFAMTACMDSFFDLLAKPMSRLLLGLEPDRLVATQSAVYTPENTPKGTWHTDEDSEVTLVVALTDTHVGGGTRIHLGPCGSVTVPQLEAGHALLFRGRTTLHYGMPVTEGERRLLVHWSQL